ncbi:diacylglycerol kinase [Thiocystis violacea]|uniref:diacylglycerol kinase n=1 Tax=Thiocystis violacea TaxID=13725 RepID=UPI0019044EA9|nr:diacylglycerol kinase [Thiocystis violacea]MBK1717245.1 diacylglycerol kinase [Thiocystis violacea]
MRRSFLSPGDAGYHPLRKIRIVLAGLRHAVLDDFSVAYKVVLSVIVLVLALVFHEWVDVELILLATGLVLMAELFNSAIESVCDFLETRDNAHIRAIKDMAAAAAGISIVIWLTVVVSEVVQLFRTGLPA